MVVSNQGSNQGHPLYKPDVLSLESTCSAPDLLKHNIAFITFFSLIQFHCHLFAVYILEAATHLIVNNTWEKIGVRGHKSLRKFLLSPLNSF